MPYSQEGEPLEIERKFLIRRPEETVLASESTRHMEICQWYLLPGPNGETRRVRRSRREGGEVWYYTEKSRRTAVTRVEREREITPQEALTLLEGMDPHRRPIEKVRWCVPFGGHTLEVDVFPFWEHQAFCEAELSAEDETIPLPAWMEVLREVTEDRRYTNNALALEIPPED